MTEQVEAWNGAKFDLRPSIYWHLTSPSGFLRHNARLGKGITYSVSAVARSAGLSEAVSPYSVACAGDPKEIFWENLRSRSYSHLPSRLKSFYCFESKELAERAAKEWFAGDADRIFLQLRVTTSAAIHRCDSKLLDANQVDWDLRADKYWKGEMTSEPFPEVIVDGAVYFPDWDAFPLLGVGA